MSKTIKYRKVINLSNTDFKRVSRVSKETFKAMVKVIRSHYLKRRRKGGKKTITKSK